MSLNKIVDGVKGINLQKIVNISILLILLMLVYDIFLKNESNIKEVMAKNNIIDHKIDSVNQRNVELTEKIETLKKNDTVFMTLVTENNKLIINNNKELVKIQREYHETIASINNYSLNDLDTFFTKKYKQFYNR